MRRTEAESRHGRGRAKRPDTARAQPQPRILWQRQVQRRQLSNQQQPRRHEHLSPRRPRRVFALRPCQRRLSPAADLLRLGFAGLGGLGWGGALAQQLLLPAALAALCTATILLSQPFPRCFGVKVRSLT